MATSVTPAKMRDTATVGVPVVTDLSELLLSVAAVLAGVGGVIHLAVARHHLDYPVITAGFVFMGLAQLLVAAGLFTRPSPRVRLSGLLLHAWIVATWLLSRAVGLVVVPGAEHRAPFGVPDTIANVFAAGVIVSLATTARVDHGSVRVAVSRRVAHSVVAVVTVGAVALAVPAAFASHDHGGHDHPVSGEPAPGHSPPVAGHDDHTHEHG